MKAILLFIKSITLVELFWTSLGLLALFLAIKIREIYLRLTTKAKELESLGLAREEIIFISDKKNPHLRKQIVKRELKVKRNKSYVMFFKYNPNFSLRDFQDLQHKFETIYKVKIDSITQEKSFFWSQAKIKLHFNAFANSYSIDEIPKINKGEFFSGRNSSKDPVILDTIKDYENTALILGAKGSGKSILARVIIYSFFEAYSKPEHKLIIVDYKIGNDFNDLLERFNGEVINPSTLSGLRRIVELLETNKIQFEEFFAELGQKKISLGHFDEARKLGLIPPQKFFFVLDEAKQYLANISEIKLSKDPDELEREEFEKFKLKKKLSMLVNNFGETNRISGSVLTVITQDSRSTSYSFDFTNFQVKFLGKQNKEQSHALTGSQIANDPTLSKGRFIAIANGEIQKIQTPLFLSLKHEKK